MGGEDDPARIESESIPLRIVAAEEDEFDSNHARRFLGKPFAMD